MYGFTCVLFCIWKTKEDLQSVKKQEQQLFWHDVLSITAITRCYFISRVVLSVALLAQGLELPFWFKGCVIRYHSNSHISHFNSNVISCISNTYHFNSIPIQALCLEIITSVQNQMSHYHWHSSYSRNAGRLVLKFYPQQVRKPAFDQDVLLNLAFVAATHWFFPSAACRAHLRFVHVAVDVLGVYQRSEIWDVLKFVGFWFDLEVEIAVVTSDIPQFLERTTKIDAHIGKTL